MSGFDEPTWVNPASNNITTHEEADTGGHVTADSATIEDYGNKGKRSPALMAMSVLNVGLAIMMAALGVLTLIEVHSSKSVKDLSEPFLATYMIMFALLLGVYEVMWWTPFPIVNKQMRKNFGFLYGLLGKGFYLIFVACLCIGLGTDARIAALNYSTGGCFMASGILHSFVVCCRPDLAVQYVAPSAGLSRADERGANVV
eukprot:scaffold4026_cov117-Cylindrotheca_fusiformis.AAC.44